MESERIELRHFCEKDYDDFRYYASQPEVGIDAGWKPHESEEESKKVFIDFINNEEIYAVLLKENGKVIGSLGLHSNDNRVGNYREIGYVLSHDYWGRGIMTEAVSIAVDYAFKQLGLDYITISAFDYNTRSQRVAEKCGFEKEGTIHYAAKRFDGVVVNLVWFILTRSQYFEKEDKSLNIDIDIRE